MYSDICGPFSTDDARHNPYIVTLIAYYSQFVMACAIRNKSDAAQSLQKLIAHFENLTKTKVQSIRSDHGG